MAELFRYPVGLSRGASFVNSGAAVIPYSARGKILARIRLHHVPATLRSAFVRGVNEAQECNENAYDYFRYS